MWWLGAEAECWIADTGASQHMYTRHLAYPENAQSIKWRWYYTDGIAYVGSLDLSFHSVQDVRVTF